MRLGRVAGLQDRDRRLTIGEPMDGESLVAGASAGTASGMQHASHFQHAVGTRRVREFAGPSDWAIVMSWKTRARECRNSLPPSLRPTVRQ
jgi:hypothetical protein